MKKIVEMLLHGIDFAAIATSFLEFYPEDITRQVCKDVYYSQCGSRTTNVSVTGRAWGNAVGWVLCLSHWSRTSKCGAHASIYLK